MFAILIAVATVFLHHAPDYKTMLIHMALLSAGCTIWIKLFNQNTLYKSYTTITGSVFLLLNTAVYHDQEEIKVLGSQLLFALCYSLLFKSYQDKKSASTIYTAFACIGLISLFCPPVLILVPVFWILCATRLMCLNLKSFTASIMGLITPYWFAGTYILYIHPEIDQLKEFIIPYYTFVLRQDLELGMSELVTGIYLLCVMGIGIICYLLFSKSEKVKVRIIYRIFLAISLIIMVAYLLLPQYKPIMVGLLIVHAVPLITQFIINSHNRFSQIIFLILLVSTLILSGFQIWIK